MKCRLGMMMYVGWLAAWMTSPATAEVGPGSGAVVDVGADQATHIEVEPLDIAFKRLTSLCLNVNGHLLAADLESREIKEIDASGRVVRVLKPGIKPQGFCVAGDGAIYCGGDGQLLKLNQQGEVLKKIELPAFTSSPPNARRRSWKKGNLVSGLAVSDRDVFVAVGSGWSMGSKSRLFRFDRDLENRKMLVDGLRGCCQRCDIAISGNAVFLAENSAYRVVQCNREGKMLSKWGSRDRTGLKGFGSCCNPMNICFDNQGKLYTAESGLGRIKRYSPEGRFIDLVGYVGVDRFNRAGHQAASCSNIAIVAMNDGDRVYVMDYGNNLIRVLERKTR